jgi:hypothetical protein
LCEWDPAGGSVDSGGVTPGWMRDFSKSTLDKQRQMVEGFVGSGEQWDADPARAAGSLFVNVGSLLMPVGGEVAAGAKVVSVGARVPCAADLTRASRRGPPKARHTDRPGPRRIPNSCRSALRAAWYPAMPCTPGPGVAELDAR